MAGSENDTQSSPLKTAAQIGLPAVAVYVALGVAGSVYVNNFLDISPPPGQYGIPMTCEPSGDVKKGIRLFIDKFDTPELTVRRRFEVVKNDGLDTNGDPDGTPPAVIDVGPSHHKTKADFDARPYLQHEGDLMLVVVHIADGNRFVRGPNAITTSDAEHGEMFCASRSFDESGPNKIRKFYVKAYSGGTSDVIGTYWLTTVKYNPLLPFIPAVVDHNVVDPNVKNSG